MAIEVMSSHFNTVRMLVGTSVTKGTFVQIDATNGGVKPAADGVEVYGVAMDTVASTAADPYVAVAVGPCEIKCQLEGTPALKQGAMVYCAGATTIDGGSATNKAIGFVSRATPAATDDTDVYVYMLPIARLVHA